jgi:iron complex outermembrane receptor protein
MQQSLRSKHASAALLLALAAVPIVTLADAAARRHNPASKPEPEISLPEVQTSAARIYPGSANDVTRTGSKTHTPLRDIPASVAVVPEALLKEQGAISMNDAMRNVSSIQPQMAGGYGFANNFTSRGLGLSFLRDGMPDGPTQNGYYRTLVDVDRIEVLKGPGSALFGAANAGGSINLVTKKPQDNYSLSGGSTFGSFGTGTGYIDLTGPMLGKAVAGRLIVNGEHTDGFRGLKRDIVEVSPSLTWHIADNKTLTIDFDHRDIQIKPDNFGILFDAKGNLANVSRETRYYTPFNKTDREINRVGVTHDWLFSDTLSLRTAVTYENRQLDLIRNLSATVTSANAATGRNARRQDDSENYTTFQNELIWKTSTGPIDHTLLGGIEYKNTDIRTNVDIYLFPNIVDILKPVVVETSLAGNTNFQLYDRKMTSDTISFYGQDQLAFGEHWKLRGGLRHDIMDYDDKGFERSAQTLAGVSKYREIVESKSFTTGSIGGVFQPTPSLAFYAGYSEGAFINLGTESRSYPTAPETSAQIEVGAKTTLLEGKVDLNLALFDTQRNNYFITLPGSDGIPTQDGKDQSQGVEMDIGLRPITGWNITGNAVWMDPETLSRAVASNALFGIKDQSIAGTRPTGVSKETFSLWNSYEIQEGIVRGLTFGLGVTHKGNAYADNLNLLKVPSYTVLDAAIAYRQPRWEVAVNLKNLTDATYYTNPTFAGALPGEPLSVYGSLRFNFN